MIRITGTYTISRQLRNKAIQNGNENTSKPSGSSGEARRAKKVLYLPVKQQVGFQEEVILRLMSQL